MTSKAKMSRNQGLAIMAMLFIAGVAVFYALNPQATLDEHVRVALRIAQKEVRQTALDAAVHVGTKRGGQPHGKSEVAEVKMDGVPKDRFRQDGSNLFIVSDASHVMCCSAGPDGVPQRCDAAIAQQNIGNALTAESDDVCEIVRIPIMTSTK
jgi:hypothetical protein